MEDESTDGLLRTLVRLLADRQTVDLARLVSGDDELLRTVDVAAILKCKKSFVYKAMVDGDLPYHRVGSDKRVKRTDLRAFIEAHRVAAGE
jgi:excisionase family DNA binding protein